MVLDDSDPANRRKFYINVCRPLTSIHGLTSTGCELNAAACETSLSGGKVKHDSSSCLHFILAMTFGLCEPGGDAVCCWWWWQDGGDVAVAIVVVVVVVVGLLLLVVVARRW